VCDVHATPRKWCSRHATLPQRAQYEGGYEGSVEVASGSCAPQVFVISSRLPSDAIVEFFTALCAVSCEELRQFPLALSPSRSSSRSPTYNMTRIRMVRLPSPPQTLNPKPGAYPHNRIP